jgi:hypothetical protein
MILVFGCHDYRNGYLYRPHTGIDAATLKTAIFVDFLSYRSSRTEPLGCESPRIGRQGRRILTRALNPNPQVRPIR